jgi:hypothetical protein
MMVVTVNPVSLRKPMGVTCLQKLVPILMVLAIVNLATVQRRIFQQEIASSTTGTYRRAVDFRLADLPHLDEWKHTLFQRLDRILQDCGSLCQNSFSRQAASEFWCVEQTQLLLCSAVVTMRVERCLLSSGHYLLEMLADNVCLVEAPDKKDADRVTRKIPHLGFRQLTRALLSISTV